MDQRTCRGCPAIITPAPRERRRREWCSGGCRQKWLRENRPEMMGAIRDRVAAKAAAERAALRPACANCGTPMQRRGGTYCSAAECRRIANAARGRTRYATDREAGRARVAAFRAALSEEQTALARAKHKAWNQRVGYTESKRANDARRRARKRAVTVERFTHLEIFERDGWRCGICDRRINRKLKRPNPKSVSLDHVIPLSLGGPHSRANVRAAHLDCNVARGAARFGADQLALI